MRTVDANQSREKETFWASSTLNVSTLWARVMTKPASFRAHVPVLTPIYPALVRQEIFPCQYSTALGMQNRDAGGSPGNLSLRSPALPEDRRHSVSRLSKLLLGGLLSTPLVRCSVWVFLSQCRMLWMLLLSSQVQAGHSCTSMGYPVLNRRGS